MLTPKQSDTGAYLYGFSRTVQREKGGALETVGYSCAEIRYWLKATVESLKMLIGGTGGTGGNVRSGGNRQHDW